MTALSSFWIHTAKLGLSAFPTASRHFQHYLSGSGHPRSVSLSSLLQKDARLRDYLFTELTHALGKGQTSGTVRIPQTAFSNWNWRLALGSITLHWERLSADISMVFHKTYSWNPFTRRISRPIHRAAKTFPGAEPFSILGQRLRVPIPVLKTATVPRKARFLGRLYL